jgi:hypothetical protein
MKVLVNLGLPHYVSMKFLVSYSLSFERGNVKLCLHLIKHHTIKMQGEVKV